MMDIKELRIGNWVMRPEDDITIQILDGGIRYHQVDILMLSDCARLGDKWAFAPIPLSPAILEKVGFKKEHEYKWKLQVNNDCSLVCNTYWNIQTYSDLIELNIKYLHQLQNLYFALTGQELQITL